MSRVEFDAEGTDTTNEPLRLTIISNVLVFSNFLIPTATYLISKTPLLYLITWPADGSIVRSSSCFWSRCLRKQTDSCFKQQTEQQMFLKTDAFEPDNRNRWQTGWRHACWFFCLAFKRPLYHYSSNIAVDVRHLPLSILVLWSVDRSLHRRSTSDEEWKTSLHAFGREERILERPSGKGLRQVSPTITIRSSVR